MMWSVLALMVCISFLSGCGNSNKQAPIVPQVEAAKETVHRKISAEEAYKMLSEIKDVVLLDVRTEEEYKEMRIDGAVLIPDTEIRGRAEKELPDKNKIILVYCRSGRRSANAARELAGLGYTNVNDIGGIVDWPYETVRGGK